MSLLPPAMVGGSVYAGTVDEFGLVISTCKLCLSFMLKASECILILLQAIYMQCMNSYAIFAVSIIPIGSEGLMHSQTIFNTQFKIH